MRLIAAALVLASVPASAAPCSPNESDPALPACQRLHAFSELDVTAAAGATARAADDGGLASESARVDASYALGFGNDIPAYSIEVAGGVTGSRLDGGGVHAWGAGTRLSFSAGPATPPIDEKYADREATAPLPIEIEHEGELAALPGLDAPADVARAAYTSEHVEARTSMMKVVFVDRLNNGVGPLQPIAIDLCAFHGELDATMQDTTRLATGWGFTFMQFGIGANAKMELLAADDHSVSTGDRSYEWLEVWPLRVDLRAPEAGTNVVLGYGDVTGFAWPDAHGGKRDGQLFAVGIGDLAARSIGWKRTPYIAMSGLPAVEDRLYAEDIVGGPYHLAARVFAARTDRATAPASDVVEWTAGVEGDGASRVGPFDVGLRAELGRSYYASLDDAAPSPGFGARAALTVSRVVKRRL